VERTVGDRATPEAQLAAMVDDTSGQLSAAEREGLMNLGRDLSAVWNDQASSIELKKRITRTLIREIVVRVEGDRLHGMIHLAWR